MKNYDVQVSFVLLLIFIMIGCVALPQADDGESDATQQVQQTFLPAIVKNVDEVTIEDIVTQVNLYHENGQIYGNANGIVNSLMVKLEGAIDARDRGQPDVACNKLNAFTNEVEAKRDKQPNGIESSAADNLITMAESACENITPTATPTVMATNTSEPALTPTPTQVLTSSYHMVYVENTHDGGYTFWKVNPADPTEAISLTRVTGFADYGMRAVLSPDEQKIAFATWGDRQRLKLWTSGLWVMNIDGSKLRQIAGMVLGGPTWTGDNQHILFLRMDSQEPYQQNIWQVNIKTGEETSLVSPGTMNIYRWQNNPVGFYYRDGVSSDSQVKFYDWTEQTSTELVNLPYYTYLCYISQDFIYSVCQSRFNKADKLDIIRIALSDGSITNVDAFLEKTQFEDYMVFIEQPNRQNITLCKRTVSDKVYQLKLINIDTLQEQLLASEPEDAYCPQSWSPDGQWLTTTDNTKRGRYFFFRHDGQIMTEHTYPLPASIVGWLKVEE
ncbi:MAG: hypothetical protein B6242_05125 [Anaerolineaceae bacterium 4572_78]|nr:MAG: hypothetical protein B6242_05125 [Anaerolineaceae bacterium 4572_78]